MGRQDMGRPFERHLDDQELDALVPSPSKSGHESHRLSPRAIHEAERHVEFCEGCSRKVSKYRQVVNRFSKSTRFEAGPRGADCPHDQDVDWYEIAAGLWPELKAKQLIMHAALCNHCGPLLRAATAVGDDEPTPQEEMLLTELKTPSQPVVRAQLESTPPNPGHRPLWRLFLQWKMLVSAVALTVIVGVLGTRPPSSSTPLSGPNFPEFAVNTHRQHAQGSLALDLRSDSQQMLNEWFKAKLQFSLVLPASPAAPGEERPYRLEGARLMPAGGTTAVYIAYHMQTGPVSLIVIPDSVTIASGGIEVDFKKVSFHYRTVEGYKVVTWSQHGLTYALVSQEGNSTQGSCMVCHSAMRDRDLSHTPTPLHTDGNAIEPVWQ
jgi:anti-sigma factor RsiW